MYHCNLRDVLYRVSRYKRTYKCCTKYLRFVLLRSDHCEITEFWKNESRFSHTADYCMDSWKYNSNFILEINLHLIETIV